MHRSRSLRKLDRVTPKDRHVIHYKRRPGSLPICAICKSELNGISNASNKKGRTTATNSRLFGGVLCARCAANIITLASRIEYGEMKLNDISIVERAYVLQMISH
ncbi:MAG: 50S ribosomal protein L34e [Candidatus Micrarchaeota archaeon]|nr:50S ribosomal protein L34e [Candidatus Micrarchaeota archaeon]